MDTSHISRFTRNEAGFTLIETLLALGIMAVLTSLAMPSFSSLLARVRVDASLSAFSNSLHFARNEAISRNRTVLICRTALAANPSALPVCDISAQKGAAKQYAVNDWASGWVVYAAQSASSTVLVDAAQVIQVVATPHPTVSVLMSSTVTSLRFTPLGHLAGTFVGGASDLALVVSHDDYPKSSAHIKLRCISVAGRMHASNTGACA